MWIQPDSNDWLKRKKNANNTAQAGKASPPKITTNIISEDYRISGLNQLHFFLVSQVLLRLYTLR